MGPNKCYHCGDDCVEDCIIHDGKKFCCQGCRTVYEIFSSNDLTYYYDLQAAAGTSPKVSEGKYDFLSSEAITNKLVEFQDDEMQVISLYIPHIHCSSCIWILENLDKLHKSIFSSQVDFPKKRIRIGYNWQTITLKELVLLLTRIGYEPNISLDDYDQKKKMKDYTLIYQLGVAGFAFGNVMFLSFPEYFEVGEFWIEQYKPLFRWLMFFFSLPVVFYAAKDYFISAFKGVRSKLLNIDVPIALGILVLFIRSSLEIIFNWGSGFFDSLTGLVFFLLLGKFFQQQTYSFLSFERDYKSYFPIAITRILNNGTEDTVQLYDIQKGDRLLIRNEELIPVDGLLIRGKARIDYSFVSGESEPVYKETGDKIYAGGKQLSGAIEMEALKSVPQSYLTQLWGNAIFQKDRPNSFQTLTDSIGKRFTIGVLTIAFISSLFWLFTDSSKLINVFTAVLIIACPCAIALAAPFTLGNMLRIFGRKKFYLKDTQTIERLSQVDMAIFDKTGTITTARKGTVSYEGIELTMAEESLLKNTLRASNHPLSRALYDLLAEHDIVTLDEYQEHIGLGIRGSKKDGQIKIGSATFVGNKNGFANQNTAVHISANDEYKGCFVFHNEYREGISKVFNTMQKNMNLAILSGDNSGEKTNLEALVPMGTPLHFNQKPEDKLAFIASNQKNHRTVLMVGDGLNDAGALAQSDVGIAISENINVFSPACDAILDATKFQQLPSYILASKKAIKVIKLSFVLSLLYNAIGLFFAVTGQLEPVIAAILMPLSSISIVAFTTVATYIIGRKLI
ncbi:heavy metal translocating P-type ATPase metal-binding domain-containing protein [Flavobacteriaceae bacterium KMM 6898]|nr:heavy metal translocating P-type ATPase metal-binding domain-containing protein [Flavobacteriaceae bacterium KMM 6898]